MRIYAYITRSVQFITIIVIMRGKFEMTIEEFREKKKLLDEKILSLIRQFEDDTTCLVDEIDLKNACSQNENGIIRRTCFVNSEIRAF